MRRHARGAALVLAMLVAALAATVAVALAAEQQRWFAEVGNRRDQVQAQSLALAGVQWARQILHDDARTGTLDYLGEPWTYPLPPTPIANGTIEGRIEDAQARLNLNNLVMDGAAANAERLRVARLFARHGLDARMLDALADWIDGDSFRRANGAEDGDYAQVSPTARAANAPLLRAAEMSAVRGVGADAWTAIANDVIALPSGTALNINTAGADVIAAAIPGFTGDTLAAFIAERARKPFTTTAELRERLPAGVAPPEGAIFATSSSYFLVGVRSQQGDAIAQARALLKRDGRNWPVVVWQTLE
ncbi:MAG: type II secretion system minor pseudopilin GspK [Burkholderiales bacterium]|nr:type II secretion system minor pseudopilin GspK [Burkholderiales bacterium]